MPDEAAARSFNWRRHAERIMEANPNWRRTRLMLGAAGAVALAGALYFLFTDNQSGSTHREPPESKKEEEVYNPLRYAVFDAAHMLVHPDINEWYRTIVNAPQNFSGLAQMLYYERMSRYKYGPARFY